MSEKLTWTEIAIQLTGEVPESCYMTFDGGIVIKLAGKRSKKYSSNQVDEAIEELDDISKAKSESGEKRVENGLKPRSEEKQPTPKAKPKAAAKPKASSSRTKK